MTKWENVPKEEKAKAPVWGERRVRLQVGKHWGVWWAIETYGARTRGDRPWFVEEADYNYLTHTGPNWFGMNKKGYPTDWMYWSRDADHAYARADKFLARFDARAKRKADREAALEADKKKREEALQAAIVARRNAASDLR